MTQNLSASIHAAKAVYNPILAEIFFVVIGLLIITNGIKALKNPECEKPKTTAAFWFLMGLSFILGSYITILKAFPEQLGALPQIPSSVIGFIIVIIAVLTATKSVTSAKHTAPTEKETRANADRIGMKIFIPALALAFVAVGVATTEIVSANNAIGVSAVVALIIAILITKAPAGNYVSDGNRLLDNMGPVVFLPQLLAALGALFTKCGVGTVIAGGVSHIIPQGNTVIAVIVYCLGMALFTIIMGNGFAAFSVITVGIAVPFLLAFDANPVVVGAMGLTAGYCGTLLTPMAANFNIMPAALLRTENKYVIIKEQAPFAIAMLLIHMVLMYILAF